MIADIVQNEYGINIKRYKVMKEGLGSNVYLVDGNQGKYILKDIDINNMNYPENEPKICEYLSKKGLLVSKFVKTKRGQFVFKEHNKAYHLQKFIEGDIYEQNDAPEWLMMESARILAKIHNYLVKFSTLPTGIGEDYFNSNMKDKALKSYLKSLEKARKEDNQLIIDELTYRIESIKKFKFIKVDFDKLTVRNTHGDFNIRQLVCGKDQINAVVDWTSACTHPVVWEIMRSFALGEQSSFDGSIDISILIEYIDEYLKYAKLNEYDIHMMGYVFYYQLIVCDYYNQFFNAKEDKKEKILEQAEFASKLIYWFDHHIDELNTRLNEYFLLK